MNTKHTPGPWTATLANTIIPANRTRIIATAWRNSELPCIPEEEQAANAKLLAAAPELLDILRTVTEYLNEADAEEQAADHHGDDSCSYCNAIAEARAIIAKATEGDLLEQIAEELDPCN